MIKAAKNLKKISLPVQGMTCASCVARVEKAISKVEGVAKVSVNFATEKASIEFDDSETDISKIKELVEDAGYKIDLSPAIDSAKKLDRTEETSDYDRALFHHLILAAIISVPVLVLNMGYNWQYFRELINIPVDYINKILMLLTTPVVFISGKRFYQVFWKNLLHKTADMNSLVAVGTGAAFSFSVLVTLFPDLILSKGEFPHVYYDTTTVIIALILMGRWLESKAKSKTNTAIKKLLSLKPKTALVKRQNKEIEIPIDELIIGDIVIVKPGGKIPADGIIVSGNSAIDESMITGESIPVEKFEGSKVIGGTINKSGSFDFKITGLGENSVLGKIIKLVEDAQGSKAPIQKLADKVASVFVPVVITIAFLTFVVWMIISGGNDFNSALINFVAVLIIACPCALGLATPTAIMVSTGKGAQYGILIKNGESLELAHKIKTIIFDKTGTITKGSPVVTDIISTNGSENELIKIVASIEFRSEHPIAESIVKFAADKKIQFSPVSKFENISGKGISAVIENKNVLIGNEKLMRENSVSFEILSDKINILAGQGKTLILIAIDNIAAGLIAVQDPVKESSKEAILKLKKMGINTIMLTGDNGVTAEAIAKSVGIDSFKAEVLPDQKAKIVSEYQINGNIVAMVGDGINDAPALAQSDVGIAIGSGTDVAMESGSIVLMNDDLNSVVAAINLSKKTIGTIKQNLFWAFIYNTLGIPLAAMGMLNPMFAALAMSFSSVSVISNSLRLKRVKL